MPLQVIGKGAEKDVAFDSIIGLVVNGPYEDTVIGSLSLGTERKFSFRHKRKSGGYPISIQLENGSLLVTKGTLIDQKRPNFCFRYFPQISTLMEIPQGNTMENSGK